MFHASAGGGIVVFDYKFKFIKSEIHNIYCFNLIHILTICTTVYLKVPATTARPLCTQDSSHISTRRAVLKILVSDMGLCRLLFTDELSGYAKGARDQDVRGVFRAYNRSCLPSVDHAFLS